MKHVNGGGEKSSGGRYCNLLIGVVKLRLWSSRVEGIMVERERETGRDKGWEPQ